MRAKPEKFCAGVGFTHSIPHPTFLSLIKNKCPWHWKGGELNRTPLSLRDFRYFRGSIVRALGLSNFAPNLLGAQFPGVASEHRGTRANMSIPLIRGSDHDVLQGPNKSLYTTTFIDPGGDLQSVGSRRVHYTPGEFANVASWALATFLVRVFSAPFLGYCLPPQPLSY